MELMITGKTTRLVLTRTETKLFWALLLAGLAYVARVEIALYDCQAKIHVIEKHEKSEEKSNGWTSPRSNGS